MQIPILHILPGLDTGGTELGLFRLVTAMDNDAFSHTVVSLKDEGRVGAMMREAGVDVYALGLKRVRRWAPSLKEFAAIIRKHEPKVIQGWLYHGNMAATAMHKVTKHNAALAWNIRQALYDPGYETKEIRSLIRASARLSGRPDLIVYNSETGRKQHEKSGFDPGSSMVIHNGFDTDLFKPSTDLRREVRGQLNIPDGDTAVFIAARSTPVKDLGNFIEAAGIVAAKEENVIFVCAGSGVDADNSELAASIQDVGIQDRIFLLGDREDIPRLLPAMDVAVLSSKSEGFPNSIGEAMSCEVPCVATDVGDTAYMIGNTGMVVEAQNPYALAEGIRDYIALGPILRKRRGQMARERIVENFSLARTARQYEMVYRNTLQKRLVL